MKHFLTSLFCTITIYSCAPSNQDIPLNNNREIIDTLGSIVYHQKDTISSLIVSHHEGTEYLDAYVDSGTVYLPDSVMQKLKTKWLKQQCCMPSTHDLYLMGSPKITERLFGDSTNYGDLWNNRYVISGKAIDVRGLGILFRIDTYQLIKNQH